MDEVVHRGQIYWAWFEEEAVGREQAGRRPVMIVNGPMLSKPDFGLAWVVPLTTRDRGWFSHLPVRGCEGLDRPTFAMTEQFRSISTKRLKKFLGWADPITMRGVQYSIQNFLMN
ncbi:MAG: type II toxin-antitoxin system PemK/MazF family toxin [Scrofimicrobium sp.]